MNEIEPKKIAVIGAGIVGVSCALFLQRDGHDVILVDPREPGTGASFGNAGIISAGSVLPIVTPGVVRQVPRMLMDPLSPLTIRWAYLPRLLPWLLRALMASRQSRVDEISNNLVALTKRAQQAHDILIQQCGAGELVRSGGWLKVAKSRQVLDSKTANEQRYLTRHNVSHHILDGDACRDLEPALSKDIGAGLWLDGNREVVNSLSYTQRLVTTFFERGGKHEKVEVTRLCIDQQKVTGLETDKEMIKAGLVVLAAGAFSRRLASDAGDRVPLDAERGYHVMLKHPDTTLRRPIYCVERGFLMAPMLDGIRLTGGVELASPQAPPDYRRIRRLATLAKEYVPKISEEIQSEWQGCRPSFPDSLPVLGPATQVQGLYYAFGHQHIGLTLGPLTGRIIADLIAGRALDIDLSPYRADRSFM